MFIFSDASKMLNNFKYAIPLIFFNLTFINILFYIIYTRIINKMILKLTYDKYDKYFIFSNPKNLKNLRLHINQK